MVRACKAPKVDQKELKELLEFLIGVETNPYIRNYYIKKLNDFNLGQGKDIFNFLEGYRR